MERLGSFAVGLVNGSRVEAVHAFCYSTQQARA